MTSAVTKDDVEAAIWQLLGVRRLPSWRVDRLLDLIDKYAATSAHKYDTVSEEPPPAIVFPEPPRPVLASLGKKEPSVRRAWQIATFKYKCRLCGERKRIDEFPPGKKRVPEGSFACLTCLKGRVGEEGRRMTFPRREGYLCRVCHTRKPITAFPQDKQKVPALSVACLVCRPETIASLLLTSVCIGGQNENHPVRRERWHV